MKPRTPARNPETLAHLGQQLRRARDTAGLAQGRVKNMRQATVSKIENGFDVTLDTLLTYAAALGLELALVPAGQASRLEGKSDFAGQPPSPVQALDLLTEFKHLQDPE
jgi:transcriptional regulator with XRE-family HTH domain